MATLNAYDTMTMIEMMKTLSPTGNEMTVAEILTEENQIMQDVLWQPSNDTFAHKVVRRLSRPTGSWRKINKGVSTEAPRTIEAWETMGMLESFANIDEALIKNSPNPQQKLSSQYRAYIEGLGEHFCDTLIYGSTEDSPEEFTGITARLNALDTNGLVIGAGGTGSDLTSVYAVIWGPGKVFMTYPMNDSPNVGVTFEDLGRGLVSDAVGSNKHTTSQYMAYRAHFKIQGGLVVEDPRCIARYANIETSGDTHIFNENDLITLTNRMPKMGANVRLYANQTIITQMQIRAKDKSNIYFTLDNGNGLTGTAPVYFNGHPIRLVEAILNTESAIS